MADGPPGSWPSQRNSHTGSFEQADALKANSSATLNVSDEGIEDSAQNAKDKGKGREIIGSKQERPMLPAEILET